MKVTYYILFVMLGVNVMTLMLQGVGIQPIEVSPYNITEASKDFNATNIVEAWQWEEKSFYDVGSGLKFTWNIISTLVIGFPLMLSSMGIPSFIVYPLSAIWGFIWVGFVISFLSGREFMP